MFDIDKIEKRTMCSLKDFQTKTVERIDYLFRNGQNRVLVADEVGMGKTLIARGAVVKTARMCIEDNKNKELFKVVYICSNSGIASQNIQKLDVSDSARIENVTDTRLSMLHLKLAQQEGDEELRDSFIQLLPLTPGTSFQLKHGTGLVMERALMFVILSRLPELKGYLVELEKMLRCTASAGTLNYYINYYFDKVYECEESSNGEYSKDIINRIYDYEKKEGVITQLVKHLQQKSQGELYNKDSYIINRLRMTFAKISTDKLEPDLVIMDEFQRYKFLLADEESETTILAKKFLYSKNTKTLLLSATPYKLYSTFEEIDKEKEDEHFKEFYQVMDFLFTGRSEKFHSVWEDYSEALRELKIGDTSIIQIKDKAEAAMYEGVCRTERISVMDSGDYTDDSSKNKPLRVAEKDITSYVEMGKLLKLTGAKYSVPVDYVKSCPYLMSFMHNYKLKKNIRDYFLQHPDRVEWAKSDVLWINPKSVNDYKVLPATNARLEMLKQVSFDGGAELYLWVPPSKPYYPLQGAYQNSKDFSKVLVFSAWEMVPRMIGAMLSYEAERKTIGVLGEKIKAESGKAEQREEKKNLHYFAKHRYPYHRLQFTLVDKRPARMSLFTLLYPSSTLVRLYNPIEAMNAKKSLADIEKHIKASLREKLKELTRYQKKQGGQEDARWYYLAPMLMDKTEYALRWLGVLRDSEEKRRAQEAAKESVRGKGKERGNEAFVAHIDQLKQMLEFKDELELGRMPVDLISTLTDMVLGSPAVCIYRSLKKHSYADMKEIARATELARIFVNYLNTTEATAVVELSAARFHSKKADDNTHWQDTLLYCKDGCFQAMFDEYLHIIREGTSFSAVAARDDLVQSIMVNDLRLNTAPYTIDTFDSFKGFCNGTEKKAKRNKMRAHYAVGFISEGEDERKTDRKNNIRGAFNSPLRPFVLASTSIGQEGLDFHNYCRRIMHWNLPSNPIDLEQREGRINRFKCLAIRQNIAREYGSTFFKADVWSEMFEEAASQKKQGQSDLVPFWCFGENQKIKIERLLPMYPMSKDKLTYERLIKILSLYRLTLGQPRQEELLEYVFKEFPNAEELKKLFINLSPFSKS